MTTEETNKELMVTLDDAWNAQDWETFAERQSDDTLVRWPGQSPTHGIEDHRAEGVAMFRAFPDNKVQNRPYKVLLADGEWTTSVARFSGTMTGPLVLEDGTELAPTGRSFEVDFCTVAHWVDGRIVEENLFYDLVGMMQQLGLNG